MEYLKGVRLTLGGRNALCNLKSEDEINHEIEERTTQGQLAGMMLTIAHQLVTVANRSDLASWNKIAWLITEESKKEPWSITFSKTSIVQSWKSFETVAHFWAAHLFLGGFWHPNTTWPECGEHEEMNLNLAYAYTFQNFGLNFKANRSPKTFLDPKILHRFEMPIHGECELGPFPQRWIETLEAYRAPKDF